MRVDSANPKGPISQLAVVMLALFGQMERNYAIECATEARAVATSKTEELRRATAGTPRPLA